MGTVPLEASGGRSESSTVKVWDIFVRVSHWTVAMAFFVAYFTEDEVLTLHVWAGYAIGIFVALRIVWGFVGPKHARFSDFLFSPFTVWCYLVDLVAFRSKRYLGHSPAGGAMTIVLLAGLAATVWSGLEVYAAEENAGPLAAVSIETAFPQQAQSLLVRISDDEHERGEGYEAGEDGPGEVWEEVHEVLANLMLALVIVHVAGVALTSIVHNENLVKAMVTGRKRAP